MVRKLYFLIFLFLIDLSRAVISSSALSQSFNMIGMKYFFTSLLKPELFIPDETLEDVTKINLDKLKKFGIRGLIFDKDNTLTEPYRETVQSKVQQFLKEANKVQENFLEYLT
jgi:phosphatidylglycerophosphatase GEP4